MTIVPAYGRDYKTQAEVLEDFLVNRDFIISDHFCPYDGKPTNLSDLRKAGERKVMVRYHGLRKIVFLAITDDGAKVHRPR
jgi:hypothetical protein